MMESDADRQLLASIRGNGGQLVRHGSGRFWATFDNPSQDASFEVDVEGSSPALAARTIDVEQLPKGTQLHLKDFAGREVEYRIEKHEPDGTGMTRVVLSL